MKKAYYEIRKDFNWKMIDGKHYTAELAKGKVCPKESALITEEKHTHLRDWRRFDHKTEVARLSTNKKSAGDAFEKLQYEANKEKWLRERAARDPVMCLKSFAKRAVDVFERGVAEHKKAMDKGTSWAYWAKWSFLDLIGSEAVALVAREFLVEREGETEEDFLAFAHRVVKTLKEETPPKINCSSDALKIPMGLMAWEERQKFARNLENKLSLEVAGILDARKKLAEREA